MCLSRRWYYLFTDVKQLRKEPELFRPKLLFEFFDSSILLCQGVRKIHVGISEVERTFDQFFAGQLVGPFTFVQGFADTGFGGRVMFK
jgi:hypothetical protein